MQARVVLWCAALFFIILAGGCGGFGGSLPAASLAEGTSPELPAGADGLPALTTLPVPSHAVSLTGPGWYPINPRNTAIRVGGQPSLPNQIVLEASGQTAYAIYPAVGFDGDCFPTSVRFTLADVTGEYYVGFSDYVAGNWAFAGPFVDSATSELPNVDEYSSPSAYVNNAGRHFFAILIPDGGGLTVNGVELGVHGGSLGPQPPDNPFINIGEASVVVQWRPSPDDHLPDFAGYFVERAPLLLGDFEPLGPPAPLTELFLLDDSGTLDEFYRYRIAAADVSGNRSWWVNTVGGRRTGESADPVAVLNLPRGPLFGPADVTFDLSQSFDPENPGIPSPSIDSFTVDFLYGPADLTGASPVMNTVLQPGCYRVRAEVEVTADMRSGGTYQTLVVYPQWQDDPVVVREPEQSVGTYSRLLRMQLGQLPATGRPVLFGYDMTIPGFAIWRQNAGGEFDLTVLPTYSRWGPGQVVDYSGEPVAFRGSLAVPLTLALDFALVLADGSSVSWNVVDTRLDDIPVAAASDGEDHLWLFHAGFDVTSQLVVMEVLSADRHVIYPNIDDILDAIDAVYNPATGMIDVAYGWFDGVLDHVEYVRWDPVNNVIDDETFPEIVLDWTQNIDIEINPNTDRPALVYYSLNDSRNHYRELQPDGVTWSADEIIDNSDQNGSASLAFGGPANHPYAFFGLGTPPNQQAQLYERDGGWAARNTVTYSTDSAYDAGMYAGAGGDLVVADLDGDGDIYAAALHDDGTETVQPWPDVGGSFLRGTEGQGFELHGTGGSDGVHVVWRNWNSFTGRHHLSPDGGATWNDAGDLPSIGASLDLTSNSNGEVYVSYVDLIAGDAIMAYWDGLAFANRLNYPCLALQRPFFSTTPGGPLIHWTAYESAANTMHYTAGDEIGGYVDNPVVLVDSPVWDGVTQNVYEVVAPMANVSHTVLAGGAQVYNSIVGVFADGEAALTPLYDPYLPPPYFFLSMPETHGRTLAASGYYAHSIPFPTDVVWATQHNLLAPVRLEYTLVVGEKTTELPVLGGQLNFQPNDYDYRRTVSAGLAWGLTAVGLVSNLGGTDVTFEWSNFGDWEDLWLPEHVRHMTMPELVVGHDGRWHIIYKNYLTDQMMSISTE